MQRSRAIITNQLVSSISYKYSFELDVIENEFLDSYMYIISTFGANIYWDLGDWVFYSNLLKFILGFSKINANVSWKWGIGSCIDETYASYNKRFIPYLFPLT